MKELIELFKNGKIQILNDDNNCDLLLDFVNACNFNNKSQNKELIIKNSYKEYLCLLVGVNMNIKGIISYDDADYKDLPIIKSSDMIHYLKQF